MRGLLAILLALPLLLSLACGSPPYPLRHDPLADADAPAPRSLELLGIYENRAGESYAPLLRPAAVSAMANGGFVLADAGSGLLHLFDSGGVHVATASDGLGGLRPIDVAGRGFVFLVLDASERTILRYDDDGILRDLYLDLEEFSPYGTVEPTALAVDVDGRMAIADRAGHRILLTGPFLALDAEVGEYGGLHGQFREPNGVAFGPDGLLYVSDRGNGRLQAFDRNGSFLLSSEGELEFVEPSGVAVDRWGNVFVCDAARGELLVLAPDFFPLLSVGLDEMSDERLVRPVDCALSDDGLLYVVDEGRQAVLVFEIEYP